MPASTRASRPMWRRDARRDVTRHSADVTGRGTATISRRPVSPRSRGWLPWGITWAVLGGLVILPLAAVAFKASGAGVRGIVASVTTPIALAALALSFGGALLSASVNTVMGTVVAWTLARYEFVGKSVANAIVDLPFALPTAVAGITLSELLSPKGWIGSLSPALAVATGRPACWWR